MKRFISIVLVFFVFCIAMVFFLGYFDEARNKNASNYIVPSTTEMSIVHSSAPTDYTEPTLPPTPSETETLPMSNFPEDILLVNPENPLPEDYYPEDIIDLYERKDRHFELAIANIWIAEIAFQAMDEMFAAAEADGVNDFIITSGYRSREEQRAIYAASTDGKAAKPGESEHETGLAFDVMSLDNIHFELTRQFEWLSQNCAKYGFIIRYPEGEEDITGFPYEPWHYRYVGTPHAQIIMDAGITLEEYLGQV